MKKVVFFVTILTVVFLTSCSKPADDPTPDVNLTCTVSSTNVTVNGGTDGTITVLVNTGTAPFDYLLKTTDLNVSVSENLSVTSNSNIFTGLSAGTYTVTVIDGNDKTFTKDVTLTQPAVVIPDVTFTATVTNVSVYGASDGKITITVNTGTFPYKYSKDNGANFQDSNEFTGLVAGTYNITVKDVNNKTLTKSVTVNQPAEVINDLVCGVTSVNASVSGNDGSITVTITSGNAPYTYTLSGTSSATETTSETTKTFNNLSTGSYTVTVTDNKSKTYSTSVTISTTYKVGDSYLGGIVIYVNNGTTTNTNYGVSGITSGHGLIMYTSNNTQGAWGDAYNACKNIGSGWRLPTVIEFIDLVSSSVSISYNYWTISSNSPYIIDVNGSSTTHYYVHYYNTWSQSTTTANNNNSYYSRAVKEF